MKAVDFYKLQRAIQDRFVGSVMSGFPPAPLLQKKGGTPKKWLWLALSALSFVMVFVVTRLGYGALDSGLSLHSWRALPLYVLFLFGFVFGLVQAWTLRVREQALPYGSGVYLFPACLIDARSDAFAVYDIKDLVGADARGSSVRVLIGGKEFVFPVSDPETANRTVAAIHDGKERTAKALATEDERELVSVDPLHNPRFSSPVGPREAYGIARPVWNTFGWLLALGAAVLVAPLLWKLRNDGSDKTMYARATKANETQAYRAYLARGVAYTDQVEHFDLPRAELRDAVKAGTVEALLAYKTAHPQSRISGELGGEIRAAMLGELEKAKAKNTLLALGAFAAQYPEHGLAPELNDAVHAVYTRALEGYRQHAPTKDKAALPFVEKLFAWAEKKGPKVEVRFRRKKSESLGRADAHVAHTPSFAGEVSYPTHYFDDKHDQKRQEILGAVLASRFDTGLSAELFDFVMGSPLGQDADALPEVQVPTLWITHGVEWSGHSYAATRPRGTYVGLIYPFDATFVIPGDPKPFKFKFDVFKQAPLNLLKESEEPLPIGQAEEKIYDVMSQEAFDTYGRKLLAHFFAEPGK